MSESNNKSSFKSALLRPQIRNNVLIEAERKEPQQWSSPSIESRIIEPNLSHPFRLSSLSF